MREPEIVNGAPVLSMQERLQGLREVYSNGINEIMDRCLEELLLPADQEMMLQDAAQFIVFLLALKVAEVRGAGLGKPELLKAYWPIEKAIKKEVAAMLLQFASARAAGGQH